jgi:hypothetical protein
VQAEELDANRFECDHDVAQPIAGGGARGRQLRCERGRFADFVNQRIEVT